MNEMKKYSGKITKKIGKPYPDVFHGIKVTTVVKSRLDYPAARKPWWRRLLCFQQMNEKGR